MTEISSQAPEMTRELKLQQIRDTLRSGQQEMADWQGGPLAVSAVPGAGKSTGMAAAAALVIAQHQLNARRQLVVVTFTRAAAANIKAKIREHLKELSLPQAGFTVNTLHGLALNIASRHPELSGLNLETVTLVTPNQSNRLIRMAVEQWIATDPLPYQRLLEGRQFDGEETEKLRRQSVLRTEVLPELATTVIHEAKSSGLLPQNLREWGEKNQDDYQLLNIAAELFQNYQNLLLDREFIDYDDMILGALRVLEDDATRRLWQGQVFAVFEDEAQDSSPLQTRLLEILASQEQTQNFVRVGDPNQAINSTFTPADPIYFRKFCEVNPLVTMDQAGRSTAKIIEAANFTLEWVNNHYRIDSQVSQKPAVDFDRNGHQKLTPETPFRFQKIRAVDLGDPQKDANPEPAGRGLEIYQPEDIFQTVELIGKRVIELITQNRERKAAVLVRENRQGQFLVDALKNPQKYNLKVDLETHQIEVFDVNERERRSHVPAEILAILQFLDRPHSPDYLKAALTVLVERRLIPNQDLNKLASLPEQLLYPGPLDPQPQPPPVEQARQFCCSLLRSRMELPLYNLILFIALALNYDQAELATADKLAEKVTLQSAGNSTMSALLNVLGEIVSSERFEAVETEDTELYTQKGKLTVITMHKAKGLDWDYVFLPFLHETLIPGSLRVPLPMQFLGDFTLSEVARAQIRAGLHGIFPLPNVQKAWQQAEQLKTAEEFRLLYVAMTRGKQLLWMSAAKKGPFTWNKLTNLQEKKPCPVLPALMQKFPNSVMS
jgi:DNA helicase-2/ATP-dependent DNA helicase PcrA